MRGVINFGIGGAFAGDDRQNDAELLDICLAEKEYLGDYGVCFGERVEPFANPDIAAPSEFSLDPELTGKAAALLVDKGIRLRKGNFVTVIGASGTAARGRQLCGRFDGLCENMEGAAIARVCQMYSVPMIELRAISNLVEDRPGKPVESDRGLPEGGRGRFGNHTRNSGGAMSPLTIGFSPCPNDTYIFSHLVNGGRKEADPLFAPPHLEDVETLNRWAFEKRLDVTKLSYHALGHVLDEYCILQSGSALGRGCGPLLIGNGSLSIGELESMKVAIPGKYTTAALLFRMFLPNCSNLVEMRFEQIVESVKQQEVAAGVIIHESRFTYEQAGVGLPPGSWPVVGGTVGVADTPWLHCRQEESGKRHNSLSDRPANTRKSRTCTDPPGTEPGLYLLPCPGNRPGGDQKSYRIICK